MIDVVAGIIIDGNNVLIARRAAHKIFPGKWEFPGGKIEKSEKPESALRRELKEEFDIKTKVNEHFKTVEYSYEDFDIRLISYFAKYISGTFNLTDHDKINWVEIPRLLDFDLAGADVPIAKGLMERHSN
jgi:8-oxo-dGTP diphosphatase